MSSTFDVLIVGAGPAGSFAAERLAGAKVRVALFDGRPIHDVVGGSTERIAHVSLLKKALVAGASAAIGEKAFTGKFGSLGAVHGFDE